MVVSCACSAAELLVDVLILTTVCFFCFAGTVRRILEALGCSARGSGLAVLEAMDGGVPHPETCFALQEDATSMAGVW
jgi:hypothetical protein